VRLAPAGECNRQLRKGRAAGPGPYRTGGRRECRPSLAPRYVRRAEGELALNSAIPKRGEGALLPEAISWPGCQQSCPLWLRVGILCCGSRNPRMNQWRSVSSVVKFFGQPAIQLT